MLNMIFIFLQLFCWVLLAVFANILKKHSEKLARNSLTNMPIKITAIENEAISVETTHNSKEMRKAVIQRNIDKITFIDTQSRRLSRIIPCMGLLCFVSYLVIKMNDTDFIPGFAKNNNPLFVYWNIISTGFIIMFLFFTIWIAVASRKEARIMQTL